MTGPAVPTLTVDDPVLEAFVAEVGPDRPVCVRGGSTRWELGGLPADGTVEVAAPAGIVAVVPDEMIVTVRAGTTVAELHGALDEVGQRTALPERGGTVGGALVVGESGIGRLGGGHVRDSLLQARYVSAEGRIVTAGGPTVKNVTGFDLCRVLVGSLGTLGLVAEVILRTRPVPDAQLWLCADGIDPTAVLGACRASSILWDGTATWVHLEGYATDVDAQRAVLRDAFGLAETHGPPALPAYRRSLSPAACASLVPGIDGTFVAEIGVGTVHVATAPEPPDVDAGVAELNRRVKVSLDPTGRLNPGRDPLARP